jgi:hypothetical protein
MTFSERHGYTKARTVAQLDSMDGPLRMALWNSIWSLLLRDATSFMLRGGDEVMLRLWTTTMHRGLDDVPRSFDSIVSLFKDLVLNGEWFAVYDFLELSLEATKGDVRTALTDLFASDLEMHLAGYRVIDGKVAPITDLVEVAEVAGALAVPDRFAAARGHLDTALALFADRETPDYANSVKESISAVESMVRLVTGKTDFHGAIDTLEKSHGIHLKLVLGWKNLYGFTSDEAGVRHGGPKPPAVTQAMARYFLITCSAFVNLLASIMKQAS